MPAGPTRSTERLESLDVLRGFALYGVFVVNASVSARPFAEAVAWPAGDPASEQVAFAVLIGAFVSKFVALFSLLFGMGLVLQHERLEARGGSKHVLRRRLAWLAVFGILHGCFLFEGDILLPYAVIGALLLWARRMAPRRLLACAIALLAIGLGLEALATLVPWVDDPNHELLLRESREEGPLGLLLRMRATEYVGWLLLSSVTAFNWVVAALFFLGAAVMKLDWIQGDRRDVFRRAALVGTPAGLALEFLAGALEELSGSPAARAAAAALFALGSVVLALGYAGIVVWAVHAGRAPRVQRALAAAGRLALTNYILQSVAMNVLFTWLGFGLYDELTRAEVIGWVTVVFAGQVLLSLLWLRRFGAGPLERIWRRLTYR